MCAWRKVDGENPTGWLRFCRLKCLDCWKFGGILGGDWKEVMEFRKILWKLGDFHWNSSNFKNVKIQFSNDFLQFKSSESKLKLEKFVKLSMHFKASHQPPPSLSSASCIPKSTAIPKSTLQGHPCVILTENMHSRHTTTPTTLIIAISLVLIIPSVFIEKRSGLLPMFCSTESAFYSSTSILSQSEKVSHQYSLTA
jgi:hypothetical protein